MSSLLTRKFLKFWIRYNGLLLEYVWQFVPALGPSMQSFQNIESYGMQQCRVKNTMKVVDLKLLKVEDANQVSWILRSIDFRNESCTPEKNR